MMDVLEGNPYTSFSRNWARRLSKLTITLARLFIQLISILGIEGFVDQVPEVDELVKIQIMTKDGAKSLTEPCLFLGIGGYFFLGITCQTSELSPILMNSHLSLGQIAKFFSLALHQLIRNMISSEVITELFPSHHVTYGFHCYKIFPPLKSSTFQKICRK